MKKHRTLHDALSATPEDEPVVDSFEHASAAEEGKAESKRAGVLVRISPDMRRQLRIIAINRNTTVQALLLSAIVQVLKEPRSTTKRR